MSIIRIKLPVDHVHKGFEHFDILRGNKKSSFAGLKELIITGGEEE